MARGEARGSSASARSPPYAPPARAPGCGGGAPRGGSAGSQPGGAGPPIPPPPPPPARFPLEAGEVCGRPAARAPRLPPPPRSLARAPSLLVTPWAPAQLHFLGSFKTAAAGPLCAAAGPRPRPPCVRGAPGSARGTPPPAPSPPWGPPCGWAGPGVGERLSARGGLLTPVAGVEGLGETRVPGFQPGFARDCPRLSPGIPHPRQPLSPGKASEVGHPSSAALGECLWGPLQVSKPRFSAGGSWAPGAPKCCDFVQ